VATRLTHAHGAPVADNLNIQTAGPRGPALLQDAGLLEQRAHVDREVIPEHRMHAKVSGAFGHVTVTQDITAFSKARLFSYGDAQRYRLGVNHHQIPVNSPRCPAHSVHRDGAMRGVSREVRQRHVDLCCRADPAYGAGVARALGLF
jgi:catalase